MDNNLIFKVQPTLSIDSVETDLNNYEIIYNYDTSETISKVLQQYDTFSFLNITSITEKVPFIEFICDKDDVDFKFTDSDDNPVILSNVRFLSGNFSGYNFNIENNNVEDANISFKIYY